MALPIFEAYQRATTATTLINNGNVRELMTAKGTIGYIPSNFNRATKVDGLGKIKCNRVLILVENGEKDAQGNLVSISLPCSEVLSNELRANRITLSELADFPILENEDGLNFISMPGAAVVRFKASDLKVVSFDSTTVSHQDLIAL